MAEGSPTTTTVTLQTQNEKLHPKRIERGRPPLPLGRTTTKAFETRRGLRPLTNSGDAPAGRDATAVRLVMKLDVGELEKSCVDPCGF
jgi:hypothetical protein